MDLKAQIAVLYNQLEGMQTDVEDLSNSVKTVQEEQGSEVLAKLNCTDIHQTYNAYY